ncbi:hypothetical protein [Nocardia sp. NPDC004722]
MSVTDDIRALTQPNHPTDWTDLDTRSLGTVDITLDTTVNSAG